MSEGNRHRLDPDLAAPSSPRAAGWRRWADVVGVALIALYLAAFVPRQATLQWDARTYLDAARAATAGLDPYDLADLARVAGGRPVSLPFLYPPVALLTFLPLALLPNATALACWLGLKAALLAALVLLWKRLAPAVEWLPLALVAVFGANGAALWDLRSGNVAMLETALAWAGLAAFAAGRRRTFAALVVGAACFKLAPAALLLLSLVPAAGRRPRPALFAGSLAALALAVWGPFAFPPASRWHGFLGSAAGAIPLGDANPSVMALARQLADGAALPPSLASAAGFAAWALVAVLVIAASARWLRRAWAAEDARRWAFAAAWLLVVLAPRPMAYGYLALAPAPLFFAPRPFGGPAGRLALALVLSAQGLLRAVNLDAGGLLPPHAPALLALALWLLVARQDTPSAAAP